MRNIGSCILVTLLFILQYSCGPNTPTPAGTPDRQPAVKKISTLVQPGSNMTIPVGAMIPVEISLPDSAEIDSMQVFLGGALMETVRGGLTTQLQTSGAKTGNSGLRVRVFPSGGNAENQSRQITFLSDLVPKEYGFSIVREYPHDVKAYTQGLHFEDGWLYEGTGNYGTSSLRQVRLETGEVQRIRNLDNSLFGEGVTILGERIYQLTYKSQVGFIYDKSTFEEIQKVYYQNREGWGLTHNGSELIMSDGTHVIYFLDPELFTVNRQIEVYHNQGKADSLNELEYIDGKIWANRYYTDEIVIIDPETGKVEGRINLKGLLKTSDRKPTTDVLNGIAWDKENRRLFVTGKFWPKLFEIKLTSLQK